jgi:poly-gamma-glutamate capsule biosynthesis protein CapA/YwtB (metallophosphatase superfamily)
MKRRDFLGYAAFASLAGTARRTGYAMTPETGKRNDARASGTLTLFVAGDVMTGRGIDQVLPHPGDPRIFEPYCSSALDYVELAERTGGAILRPVDFAYIWGDALAALDAAAPGLRIVNLETAVTRTGSPWPGKGIQYRMHPDNMPCLSAAHIDCCVLANNHVLDWGYAGFEETLASLTKAGITTAGAGADAATAVAPAAFSPPGGGRVLIFAWGARSSGIPAAWAAGDGRPGVNLLEDVSERLAGRVATAVQAHRRPGDRVVVSLHWGGNWGYAIPEAHRRFAHALVDMAGVDLVHGHSSHHPLGIEVYGGRAVVYGCGDLIDDYEGISGHERYRTDLALLHLVRMDGATGELRSLEMIPLRRQRFRLNAARAEDLDWLHATLDRECRRLGAAVVRTERGTLRLQWS